MFQTRGPQYESCVSASFFSSTIKQHKQLSLEVIICIVVVLKRVW